MRHHREILMACTLCVLSCDGGSPSAPSAPSIAATPAPIAEATPTPTPPNAAPTGSFGLQPPLVDGVVRLEQGGTLRVSGGKVSDPDPADMLRLVVDWGDGDHAEIGCGTCRLEHVYTAVGSFDVVVTVTDERPSAARASAELTERFRVSVTPATAPRVTSFTATPASIVLGANASIAWATTDANRVSILPGIGLQAANGSVTVSPTATTTYLLTALDANDQEATAQVTVAIVAPVIATFTATPGSIDLGTSSTLAWSGVTSATSCAIDQGIGAVSCAAGDTSVSPTSATTYTLSATGPGGTTTANASVSLTAPTAGTLSASPTAINSGSSSTLSWTTSSNATSCSIDNGVGSVPCSVSYSAGSTSVSPTSTTTYTLTATGPGGSDTDSVTIRTYPTAGCTIHITGIPNVYVDFNGGNFLAAPVDYYYDDSSCGTPVTTSPNPLAFAPSGQTDAEAICGINGFSAASKYPNSPAFDTYICYN